MAFPSLVWWSPGTEQTVIIILGGARGEKFLSGEVKTARCFDRAKGKEKSSPCCLKLPQVCVGVLPSAWEVALGGQERQ